MRNVAIAFAITGLIVCGFVAYEELRSASPRWAEIGNLIVLTLTLVVLVWYACDTNLLARVTQERWLKEGVLNTTYEMHIEHGSSVGDRARTVVKLRNPSPLLVRATVNLNLEVYGQQVSAGPLYDGHERWLVFPQQVSQGWFDVEAMLQQVGKSMAQVRSEHAPENQRRQLTARLELKFEDEFKQVRHLPVRFHYFDFGRWAWIPALGEGASGSNV